MVERDYGYVAATFAGKDIEPFQKLTESVCSESDLYHPDTVDYVNGNVSTDLHLTVFYGLVDAKIDREELQAQIDKIQLEKLRLGELFLRQTPDNSYQILWIVVKDDNRQLQAVSDSFKRFDHDDSVQLEFMPHLTLAYVKPEYRLENSMPDYPREIKVEEVKYFEK